MKIRFVYKGGEGSGFHGHAGRPGKVGGSIAYNYSNIPPSQRSNPSYYQGGGSYKTDVDAALVEPVRILNEELGYNTFASCEGHACDWEGSDVLGMYEKIDRISGRSSSGMAFQESYISIYSSEEEIVNLEKFLKSNGFELGSTPRSYVNETSYDLYKNIGNHYLLFDVTKPIGPGGRSIFSLRIGSGTLNPSKSKLHVMSSGESFINIRDSLNGQKALSQKDWDNARDAGWNSWINILRKYKKQ